MSWASQLKMPQSTNLPLLVGCSTRLHLMENGASMSVSCCPRLVMFVKASSFIRML